MTCHLIDGSDHKRVHSEYKHTHKSISLLRYTVCRLAASYKTLGFHFKSQTGGDSEDFYIVMTLILHFYELHLVM